MAEFETLQAEEIKLSKGLLIVAAKRIIGENGASEFIVMTKADEQGKFKETLTVPMDKQIVAELVKALQTVV